MSALVKTEATRELTLFSLEDTFGLEGIKDVIPGYATPHELCPTHLLKKDYAFQPAVLGWIRRAIIMRRNLMLVGAPGTGKSSHLVQTFIRLNQGFTVVKGSSDIEPSSLFGSYVPLADGSFGWVDGPVTRAARLGIPCLIEERDAIMSDASVALNSVMDGMPIELEATGERIIPKPGFFIVATGNTVGSGDDTHLHVTSKQQPMSTNGRFLVVEVDYMSEDEEVEVLSKVVPVADDDIDASFENKLNKEIAKPVSEETVRMLVQYANGTRAAVKENLMTIPLSTRELIDAVMFVGLVPARVAGKDAAHSKLDELLDVTYWNKLPRAEREVAKGVLETLKKANQE